MFAPQATSLPELRWQRIDTGRCARYMNHMWIDALSPSLYPLTSRSFFQCCLQMT